MEPSEILKWFDLTEQSFPQGSKFVQHDRFGNNALIVIVPKGTSINTLGYKSHILKTLDGVWFEEVELPNQEDKPEPLRDCIYLRVKDYD